MDAGHFGRRLREARDHRGLTQDALAGLVGMDPSSLRNYERRETPPRYGRFIPDLEHALGVKLVGDGVVAKPPKAPAAVDEVDPRVSQVDPEQLVRVLSAKLHAQEAPRRAAVALVDRLARGDWAGEAQRDAWASTIKAALVGDPAYGLVDASTSDDRAPDGGTPGEGGEQDATVGPFGEGIGISHVEIDTPISDPTADRDDSAQA